MKNNFRLTISLVILSIICVVTYIFYVSNYNRNLLISQSIYRGVTNSEDIFNVIKAGDINALSTVLDTILQDKGFRDIFLKKDRVALFDYSQPLFQSIKKDYGITHFYFHLPDGTNFVRIHDKTKFDDKITRLTFNQAVESKVIGSGIELGKTAFALRVVKPYYNGNELIGYLELGQEIDHFLGVLKEKTGNNYSIFVTKSAVDQATWVSVRKANGLDSNWNNYNNLVEMNSTVSGVQNKEEVPKCLNEKNAQNIFDLKTINKEIIGGVSNNTSCAGFELLDAENNRIGVVLLSSNISADLAIIDSFVNNQRILMVVLLVFVLIFSYLIYTRNLQAQKKYKYLFNGSKDAILTLVPPNWNFFDGNNASFMLFGFKDVKELKKTTPDKVSPERQPNGNLSSVQAKEMIELALDKGTHSFEWVHKKITGEEFIANVILTKISIGREVILQAVLRDITAQKKADELIIKANEEVKKELTKSEQLNKYMVGRELKMVELKKQIRQSDKNKNSV